MLIVLDTNVYQEDWGMNSGRFRVLLDYAERTQATFLLPRIVHDELAANYRRALEERLATFMRARAQVHGIAPAVDVPAVAVDVEQTTREYMRAAQQRLRIRPPDVLEHKPEYLGDVLARAVERRRPCNAKGEEIRDAVLWLTLLDAAADRREPLVFVSRNVAQFGSDKAGGLHPDLAAEAAARALAVDYVPSLQEFARRHHEPIAFITEEWLQARLDADSVVDFALDPLIDAGYQTARLRHWAEEVEDVRFAGGGVDIDEFFVNVLSGDELRVEVHWYGIAAVEYHVLDADHAFDHWLTRARTARTTHEVEVVIRVTTQATVRNEQVVEWCHMDVRAERR